MRNAVILQKKDKSSCILTKKVNKIMAYSLLLIEKDLLFLYIKLLKY